MLESASFHLVPDSNIGLQKVGSNSMFVTHFPSPFSYSPQRGSRLLSLIGNQKTRSREWCSTSECRVLIPSPGEPHVRDQEQVLPEQPCDAFKGWLTVVKESRKRLLIRSDSGP